MKFSQLFTYRANIKAIIPVITGILLILAACAPVLPSTNPSPSSTNLEIETALQAFYRDLGAEKILGPAISILFNSNGAECQYTANALLCRQLDGETGGSYFLAPLGSQLVPVDPPGEFPPGETRTVINGYAIDNSFLTLYQKLGGEQTCGLPLSQVQVNQDKKLVFQYFENIGFYRKIDDTGGEIRLMPYGAQACGSHCANTVNTIHGDFIINTPFAEALQKITGSASVFGQPLSEPYLADSTNLAQIYPAILVSAPLDQPERVTLQPLPVLLGMPASAPSKQVYGLDQNMVFYPVAGNLGYHIPVYFKNFIDNHGGTDVSGRPLAEPMVVYEENLARQCFENYCLDYHVEMDPDEAVSLSRLGQRYLEKITEQDIKPYIFPEEEYSLQAWEDQARIHAEQNQVIYAMVFKGESKQPAAGLEVIVTVAPAESSRMVYLSPATDQNGFTSLEIGPFSDIENGSLVNYQACLNLPLEKPVCISDSYMIWSVP